MIYILVITNLVFLCTTLFLWDELRHRDRHLKWVDERDKGMAFLFEKVNESRVVPMSNFLAPWKEHGMISKNAVMHGAALLQEADERINYYLGFLQRSIKAARDLIWWETSNQPPPVSRWKRRQARVSTGEPDVPQEDHLFGTGVEPTKYEMEQRAREASKDRSFGEVISGFEPGGTKGEIGPGAFGPEGRR